MPNEYPETFAAVAVMDLMYQNENMEDDKQTMPHYSVNSKEPPEPAKPNGNLFNPNWVVKDLYVN